MSKFTLYDWRCAECELKFESYQKPDVFEIPCKSCSGSAKRLISAPRIAISGTDPDFPTAYAKWGKTNKQKVEIEKKWHTDTGTDKFWGGDVQ